MSSMDIEPHPSRKRRASSSPPGDHPANVQSDSRRATIKVKHAHQHDDSLSIIAVHDAWQLHVPTILGPYAGERPSLSVLCVISALQVQFDFLCGALPYLQDLSPGIRVYIVAGSPAAVPAAMTLTFPTIRPSNPVRTYTSLGISHPFGGRPMALDAVVLMDRAGRRRLVLPFGWGAGKYAADEQGGGLVIQERLADALVTAVGHAEEEWKEERLAASDEVVLDTRG
jgi:hypothetical protein